MEVFDPIHCTSDTLNPLKVISRLRPLPRLLQSTSPMKIPENSIIFLTAFVLLHPSSMLTSGRAGKTT